jgi:hypothetical protein
MSRHSMALVLEHVHTQITWVAVAGVALQTHKEFLPGGSPHVGLHVGALSKALLALIPPVGLHAGVSPHVGLQVAAPT